MKYSLATASIILTLFLITEFVGLEVNNEYMNKEPPYGMELPQTNQNNSPFYLIGMIIIASGIFLVLSKLNVDIFLKGWFFIAVTACIAVTLSLVIQPLVALLISAIIVFIKYKKRNIYIHNIGEILTYGGLIAMFAPMLNTVATIILLILMSIYDYISVFVTKHMIKLAKLQSKLGILSGLIVTNKNELAILGGGDIAFTLLFSAVVLREFGMMSAIFSIIGATALIAILMVIGKKKKYYPAMPFVTVGSLLGFLLSFI